MTSSDAISARLKPFLSRLVALPRPVKRAVLVGVDVLLLSFALWLVISVRLATIFVPATFVEFSTLALAPLLGVVAFAWSGLYRLVTRFMGPHGIGKITGSVLIATLAWAVVLLMIGAYWVPRTSIIMYPIAGAALTYGIRQLAGAMLQGAGIPYAKPDGQRRALVIYGAGPAGVQLAEALRRTGEAEVVGFIDDQAALRGQYLAGIKVWGPEKLARLIERAGVSEVILALPEAERRRRRAIVESLAAYPVGVRALPAIEDFASGRVAVNDLKPVDVVDLLGRDPVPADPLLLARHIKGRSVMVTGAGGSIGSELVRQILKQRPEQLVLYEISESALYEIETEIADQQARAPATQPRARIVSVMGSVLDGPLLASTIKDNGVATIYHAAAYKHVPIVERNPVAGLTNNTFGTAQLVAAARACAVARVVLISTDKAVRPTNVMGASKRLAELLLQAEAADPTCETVFTMVRFGNVLDSSGSVVRRFRRQIEDGGPVTVTHAEVIRYFMSIPEAAELVIQAGAMASGGEVFVLEMGEPVRIYDLARTMIRLMGREVRDAGNPDGDIEIVITGLRPGEKLREELLLGDNISPTAHPRIMRSREPVLPADVLKRQLSALTKAMETRDDAVIRAVLAEAVEGYEPGEVGSSERGGRMFAPLSRTVH